MNDEEIRSTVEQVRAQMKSKEENKDKSDDEIDELILDNLFKGYTEGEMSKSDLEEIANFMGYEFTEEFAEDEEAAEMVEPSAAPEGVEGVSKEDLEETRTIGEGESAEDFKKDIEDINAGEKPESESEEEPEADEEEVVEEDEEEDEEIDDEDEDAQREAASKLFGTDLRKK